MSQSSSSKFSFAEADVESSAANANANAASQYSKSYKLATSLSWRRRLETTTSFLPVWLQARPPPSVFPASAFTLKKGPASRLPRYAMLFLGLLAVSAYYLSLFVDVDARPNSDGSLRGSDHREREREGFVLNRSWASYSPYFSVREYVPPPSQCTITQVNILQRHGARFPTSGAAKSIQSAITKLQKVKTYEDSKMNFLRNFTYDLGTDDLVAFGAAQSSSAGAVAFQRYKDLVSEENIPFVRASGSTRVVMSATNWTAGFAAASDSVYNPVLSVILSEDGNDTLDDAMCPNAGGSSNQTNTWLAVYAPPITARLNAGAPGANLTDAETYSVQSLCPFESVAKEEHSSFCDLFSDEEFEEFEYAGDLDKYYNTGYGQPLGPVQGVGYINELLARLTSSPVIDHTQTNRTLDSSPLTFPLNRTIYADFSHDNEMIPIYSAMGLFKQSAALDPTKPDPTRNWLASQLVPFSARMVVEKMSCYASELVSAGEEEEKKEFVRVLVNDAVQPLEFCGSEVWKDEGLCELSAFVESQSYARSDGEGDFEKCFS